VLIRLEDIVVRAYHGVLPEERTQGNWFVVNVTLTTPAMPAIQTDRLEDTLDYAQVYQVVKREMAQPSQLLEHVAGRIVRALMDTFPGVGVSVQVRKQHPPVGGDVAWSSVEVCSEDIAPSVGSPRRETEEAQG